MMGVLGGLTDSGGDWVERGEVGWVRSWIATLLLATLFIDYTHNFLSFFLLILFVVLN